MTADRPVTPLSVSWREWLQTPDWQGDRWAGPAFDAIVVGSGYGGSVAALRLAQKNYRVLVLERGSEYLPGEFPNDFSLVPKFFRVNLPTRGLPIGRATGLIEAHLGEGLVGVTGNGLGGGSLVNAGVVMQPDPDVFAQPAWPVAIRHAHDDGGMPKWFGRARAELGVHAWDARLPGGGRLQKTQALHRLGGKLGRAAAAVDATIDPQHCKRCGDCASGCNVAGAKQSLDRTYLRKAHATGLVQIVTQAEVYCFEPSVDAAHGWTVQAFATDAQQQFLATAQLFTETKGRAATARQLTAPMLFVCAGTFGSTQLLQRSQSLSRGRLAFSGALGTRVSGNGDSLSWLVGEKQPVGAVGLGERGVAAWNSAAQGQGTDTGAIVGPTITAAIDLRKRADGDRREPRALPLTQRVVIEDGAVPRAIAQVFHELLATASTLKQLDGWWFRRHGGSHAEDPLAASASQARHAQTLLAMGHDGSPARLVWLEASDRSAPYLPAPEKLATYQRQQEIFDRFGCRHVHNPLWQPMPQSALKLMSGDKPPRSVVTVHPLGGCVMGDDPETSVVNDGGQVWVREPGRGLVPAAAIVPAGSARAAPFASEPHLYRGLHVLDGSIVPTSLGCNPLWTITALAERALDAIPAKPVRADVTAVRQGARRTPRVFPSVDVPVEAALNESLLGRGAVVQGPLVQLLGSRADARLDAVFRSKDIVFDLRQRRHRMPAEAALSITCMPTQQQVQQGVAPDVLLRYTTAQGRFDVLPASRDSTGPWLAARSLAEVLLLLAVVAGEAAALIRAPSLRRLLLLAACGVALPVLLPFPRTFLTWLIQRGLREGRDAWRNGTFLRSLFNGGSLAKQLVHASEVRVMRYRLEMQLEMAAPGCEKAPQQLTLHARKRVMYRASIGEFLAWMVHPWERKDGQLVWRPVRESVWNQVMNAQVRVVQSGAPWRAQALLSGRFEMGFENLTSSGLAAARRGAKGPMELGGTGDTTSGMLALAGYPMLFLRYAFKTRLLDARLPTYSGVPLPDQSPAQETWLRTERAWIAPDLSILQVPRGRGLDDARDDSTAPLKLPLRRYRHIDDAGQPLRPELVEADCNGRPVVRAKAVLLLHAFAQSGLCFTFKTVEQNLAEAFFARGYEVWILENRMSTRSGHADEPSSMDQIAAYDIPVAVRHMVDTLATECGTALPLQVSAFAQCLGSASLWMSVLSGALVHPKAGPLPEDDSPCLSMLSHAMFSQVHPWVVGSRFTQSKTWLPSLLQAVCKHGSIPFAVRGAQAGFALPLLDRALASMPVPDVEARRFGGNEDAAATCRRIRFIEAPLFQHANINDATFGALNLLFGDANLRTFAHARRFVDRERLVTEDGINRYVTRSNLRRHLAFPVHLMHGEQNELFDVRSATRSFQALRPTHRAFQRAFCLDAKGNVGPLIIEGHGHVDVLLGAQAHKLVFPHVLRFFDTCFATLRYPQDTSAPPRRWSMRAPRVGPFVGWLREQEAAVLLRVSFVIDDRNSCDVRTPPATIVRFWDAALGRYRTLKPAAKWKLAPMPNPLAEGRIQRLAWADLLLEGDARRANDWQLFTLHESPRPGDLASDAPADEDIEAWLQGNLRPATLLGPVVRPLGASHRIDQAATLFHVPQAAFDSMPHGHALRFAASCCRHPGLGVDRARVDTAARAFLETQDADPVAFALLVGDQIYADATAGLVDPSSPLERYHERHAQAFDREGLGELLARMPVYMTPDDHEFIDGYPADSPIARDPWPDWKPGSDFMRRQREVARIADAAVSDFQRLQSPLGGRPRSWYTFAHGCARFFVIDSRIGRRRDAAVIVRRHVLPAFAQWLQRQDGAQDMLDVVVCGSVVMPGLRMNADPANPGPIDTWQYAPQERAVLLDLLVQQAPGRFLLLSGDYHVSGAGYVLHEPARPSEADTSPQTARIVGAAVVVPPLYAPMPYANAGPETVDDTEAVDLGGQRGTVHFRSALGAQFARGSGLAVLDVARQPAGGYCIWLRRDLRVWESGRAERHEAVLCLPPAPLRLAALPAPVPIAAPAPKPAEAPAPAAAEKPIAPVKALVAIGMTIAAILVALAPSRTWR